MEHRLDPFIRFLDVFPFLTTYKEGSIGYDCRLFYVLEGSFTISVEGEEFVVSKKKLLYIPAGIKYCVKNTTDERNKIITINFDFTQKYAKSHKEKIKPIALKAYDKKELLSDTIPSEFANYILFQCDDVLEEEFLLMYHYSLSQSRYTDDKISALLKHILYVVLEYGEQEKSCIPSGLVPEIEQYILNNYTNPELSNESVAKKYNYNSFYLNLIFKKALNITMHQYVISLRIKLAKRLIRETEKSMTEIAMEVGFNSPSYFSQVFRKTQGCSPADYRKSYLDFQ